MELASKVCQLAVSGAVTLIVRALEQYGHQGASSHHANTECCESNASTQPPSRAAGCGKPHHLRIRRRCVRLEVKSYHGSCSVTLASTIRPKRPQRKLHQGTGGGRRPCRGWKQCLETIPEAGEEELACQCQVEEEEEDVESSLEAPKTDGDAVTLRLLGNGLEIISDVMETSGNQPENQSRKCRGLQRGRMEEESSKQGKTRAKIGRIKTREERNGNKESSNNKGKEVESSRLEGKGTDNYLGDRDCSQTVLKKLTSLQKTNSSPGSPRRGPRLLCVTSTSGDHGLVSLDSRDSILVC